MANDHLLDIKDLHVQFDVYGGQLKVLDGVNFHMAARRKSWAGGRDRLR